MHNSYIVAIKLKHSLPLFPLLSNRYYLFTFSTRLMLVLRPNCQHFKVANLKQRYDPRLRENAATVRTAYENVLNINLGLNSRKKLCTIWSLYEIGGFFWQAVRERICAMRCVKKLAFLARSKLGNIHHAIKSSFVKYKKNVCIVTCSFYVWFL